MRSTLIMFDYWPTGSDFITLLTKFTVTSRVPWLARTVVSIRVIGAVRSILAWHAGAFVYIWCRQKFVIIVQATQVEAYHLGVGLD